MAPVMESGAGCRVQDLDGNEYVEFGSGLRSVTLGHGYEPVLERRAPLAGSRGQLHPAARSSATRPSG